MPGWDAKEVIQLLYLLLPGFAAAWVFYGLTAHPKLDWFERIIQALIFTVTIQAAVFLVRELLHLLSKMFSFGTWTVEVQLVWSLGLAVLIGVLFSAAANHDKLHSALRERGITKRTSFPSEWYSAFCRNQRWVVLHLQGERRLFGWPHEWPDRPDRGHFVIDQPEWIEEGTRKPITGVDTVLVRVDHVEMVEFMKYDEEVAADEARENLVTKLNQVTN